MNGCLLLPPLAWKVDNCQQNPKTPTIEPAYPQLDKHLRDFVTHSMRNGRVGASHQQLALRMS